MANKCATLEELYTWCLTQHYEKNDHHPEHFRNPDIEMPLIARMELTCDLLGSVLGTFKKKQISVSLSECRFVIEHQKQKWKHWKYAIKDYLPSSSNIVPDYGKRWGNFPQEEKEKLRELFDRFKKGVCIKVIQSELENLQSVQHYLEDLKHHKEAVKFVWKEIPEFAKPGMLYRIQHHDDDKFDTIMILGYTANWCFEEKTQTV